MVWTRVPSETSASEIVTTVFGPPTVDGAMTQNQILKDSIFFSKVQENF